MSECPTTEELDALISGLVSSVDSVELEAHIETCRECQKRLDSRSESPSSFLQLYLKSHAPAVATGNWDSQRGARLVDAVRNAIVPDDAATSKVVPGPAPQIPGYRVGELIGRGGMGTVYSGTQLDLDRDVAIKVLDVSSTHSMDELTQRFSHEARITANLDHPSIIPVHAVGQDSHGRLFYTMRRIRGNDLRVILRNGRNEDKGWNRTRVIAVLVRICQTIEFAHERNVIHRDLKPSNVMVGELGEVYVLDWGLAKVVGQVNAPDIRPTFASTKIDDARRAETKASTGDSTSPRQGDMSGTAMPRKSDQPSRSPAQSSVAGDGDRESTNDEIPTTIVGGYALSDRPLLTVDGTVIGTPAFMPREQALGELDKVDQLSDVYALGAILYELLVGAPPYRFENPGSGPATILKSIIAGPPAAVSTLAPNTPRELAAVCEKAMARDRDQRYSTAALMAEELQAFLDNRVVQAYQSGAIAEAGKWIRRNRGVAALSLLTVLSVIVGLSVSALLQVKANRDLSSANQQVNDAFSQQQRASGDLRKANVKLQDTSDQLRSASRDLENTNAQLTKANTKVTKALQAETTAKQAEREAKIHAYSLLAESYANFGVQEADQDRLARGALWFTKAAELSDQNPELQHSYHMTAMQFRQAARLPIAAWWDRQNLKKRGWLDWPMTEQFFFDPTKRYLLARGHSGTAIFELLNDAEPLWGNTRFAFAAFSPKRDVVAVVTKKQEISIRRLADQEIVQKIPTEGNGTVKALDYSHDGRLLFIGTSPAKVWDVERSRYFDGHYPIGEWVHDMGFSSNDEELLVETQKTLKVFKVVDADGVQQPTSTLMKDDGQKEAEREVRSRFTLRMRRSTKPKWPDGTDFDREALDHFGQHGDVSVQGTAFDAENSQIAMARGHGIFRLWQEPKRPYWFIRTDGLARPAFSPDSKYVAAVGHLSLTDDDVPAERRKPELLSTQVFDSATGQPAGPEIRVGVPILDGCFSPERPLLAFACAVRERRKKTTFLPDGQAGTVQLWDWQTGQMQGEPFLMPSEPQAIAWHPTRDQIAVGCAGGQVLKIDIVTREVTEIYNREMKSTPWLLAPGEWDSIGLAFDPTGEILSWWGGLKAQLLDFSKGGIRFEPSFGTLWTNIQIHNDVCLFSFRGQRPLALRITKGVEFKWIKQKDGEEWQHVGFGSLARLSQDGKYVVSSATTARQTSVWDIDQGQIAASFGERAVDVNFIHNTTVIITVGDTTPDSVRFWDRQSGHLAAPTQHIPGSRFTGWIRVSENGRFAAMTCTPYGLLVFDLRSLHEDPLQDLSPADAMLLAEINAGASINDGKLTKLEGPEWTSRWDDFKSRHPNFRSRAVPLSLTIRDHQTRAHKFDILKNTTAAEFHRRIADKLLSEPSDSDRAAAASPKPIVPATPEL